MSLGNVIALPSGGFPTHHGRVSTFTQTGGPATNRFLTFSWTALSMGPVTFTMNNLAGAVSGMTASGGGLQVTNAGKYRIRGLAICGFTDTVNFDGNTFANLSSLTAGIFVNGTIASRGICIPNTGMASTAAGQMLLTVDDILDLPANAIVTFRWDAGSIGNFGATARYQAEMRIESVF
jgi:hypothetical protein